MLFRSPFGPCHRGSQRQRLEGTRDVVCTQEMILSKALFSSANLNDVGQVDRSHLNQF